MGIGSVNYPPFQKQIRCNIRSIIELFRTGFWRTFQVYLIERFRQNNQWVRNQLHYDERHLAVSEIELGLMI